MIWVTTFILGIVAGVGIGWKQTSSTAQNVPLIKFVPKGKEKKALEDLHIRLGNNVRCTACNDRISSENLGAIIKSETGDTFYCVKSQCLTIAGASSRERELMIRKRST